MYTLFKLCRFTGKKKAEDFINAFVEAYKDVYVFPTAYDSKFKGNNKLIKEGANIITNMEDLVDN